jgi:hypothetical protein
LTSRSHCAFEDSSFFDVLNTPQATDSAGESAARKTRVGATNALKMDRLPQKWLKHAFTVDDDTECDVRE